MRNPSVWQSAVAALAVVCGLAGLALWMKFQLPQSGTLQERVNALASQLRAPGDENTMTVASSSSQMAQHIKYEIQQDLLADKSNQQIIEQMVKEYGPEVYAAPPFTGFGAVAWLTPVLFVAAGVLAAVRFLGKQSTEGNSRRSDAVGSGGQTPSELPDSDVHARLRDWL
jgi:cytochrome c-type biogenesis protein CcmH/NrfF